MRTPSISSFFVLGLIAPALVLALDYTPDKTYPDVPAKSVEAAAVNMLTNLGAVSGNPDGTFAPSRTLNRAEFTKIALLSYGMDLEPAQSCFPDVPKNQWFSIYVCTAKAKGIIKGNPDGLFHPERSVNYAEAVTILGRMFGYVTDMKPGDQWYHPYLRAAAAKKVLIPASLDPDDALTRGEMARLTAAVVAEDQGELAQYRAAEQGKAFSSSSSVSESSSSASSASSATSSSASSTSSTSSVSSSASSSSRSSVALPAISHLLILGQRTPAIAGAKFFASKEDMYLQQVTVKLKRKIESIDAMYLVDEFGMQIGQLALDTADGTRLEYKATFSPPTWYVLPRDTERQLAVELLLKGNNAGGTSQQAIQVDTWYITTVGKDTNSVLTVPAPSYIVFPEHQTTQARITGVKNLTGERGSMITGPSQVIGTFSFSGTYLQGASLRIKSLEFTISKSSSVAVNNWHLSSPNASITSSCSISQVNVVLCSALPVELGSISNGAATTLRLMGDVAVDQGAVDPFLQVTLNLPGTTSTAGAIRWTDGAEEFTWVELGTPIARGTLWK